jgi:nucleotide-binding universal stress UspA family protein
MFKKILVPLDGSKFAEGILGIVKGVATGYRTPEVVLLWVAEPIRRFSEVGEDWRSDIDETVEVPAKEYLSRIAANLKKEGIATVKVDVVWGRAAEEILNYVKNNQVDLVIMSTHGRSGVSHWMMGSVAERVVRHSSAPVLVASPIVRQ